MERAHVASALLKKGFVEDETRDHRYFHHQINGQRTGVRTKLSRGSQYKRLGPQLLAKIKKQPKLESSREFRDLVNCPMSKERYIEVLKSKEILDCS